MSMASLDLFDARWYEKTFSPLVMQAKRAGVNINSPEAFLSWINANKERKSANVGIQWWITETSDTWLEMIDEVTSYAD